MIGLMILAISAGCTSIPERELENAFKYQRLKRHKIHLAKPIESEYQDLASKAWENKDAGGTAEYISILELGDDALLARIHMIRSAKKGIDVQTFIWKDDSSSRFVFDELVKAAERGVLVRLLIDGINNPGTPQQLAKMVRSHRNLEIALYKPLRNNVVYGHIGWIENLMLKTRHMNRRMHNKLMLVDGRVGIAGGRNYQNRYFDRDSAFLFRDRDVLVAGPAVMDMQDSFELFWQDKRAVFLTQMRDVRLEFEKMTNERVPMLQPENEWMFEEISVQANEYALSKVRKMLRVYEADKLQFIYDAPSKFRDNEEVMGFDEWFQYLVQKCNDRLVLQTPYLIYSRGTRKGFQKIRKDHPNFRIIASSNSLAAADHISVYAISFKHRKELYKKSGIDIYESKPFPADQANYVYNYEGLVDLALKKEGLKNRADVPDISRAGPRLCIHAKSLVLDGKISLIGSHNFDPRSAKLNTECGVFIYDEEIARELEARILAACEPRNSWTVSKGPTTPIISHFSGFIGAISTALPVFDIWPYRYTTNYELKEGAEVLSPRDPNFQKNYVNVGYFPEVPEMTKVIQTRLMKGFFGWARPLM